MEQALRRYEELEKGILPARTAGACSELGKLALLIGDYEKAKAWLQQSMDHFQKAREPNRQYFEALYTVSKLFGAQGQKQDAVQLLSVMQSQTSNPYIRDRVATSLAELQTALPDNIYAAAIERGRSLDLDIVVTEFLAT